MSNDNGFTGRIGVHVLSESVFCLRAGVIAYEGNSPDQGDDDYEEISLGYLPPFDIEELETAMQQKLDELKATFIYGLGIMISLLIIGFFVSWWFAFVLLLCGIPLYRWALDHFRDTAEFLQRHREWQTTEAEEPNPSLRVNQHVNWWGLLKAGFVPMQYSAPLCDTKFHLVGKPWYVLVRGSLRIPVFRSTSQSLEVREPQVLRITAYCYLLRECEGAESPYGIILFGDHSTAVAVPVLKECTPDIQKAVDRFKKMMELQEVMSGHFPPAPTKLEICRGCPFGYPGLYIPQESETFLGNVKVAPHLAVGMDQQKYHSTCGDRFCWTPPHEVALEKNLN